MIENSLLHVYSILAIYMSPSPFVFEVQVVLRMRPLEQRNICPDMKIIRALIPPYTSLPDFLPVRYWNKELSRDLLLSQLKLLHLSLPLSFGDRGPSDHRPFDA